MDKIIEIKNNKIENDIQNWLIAFALLFPLLPEYLAPFVLFIGFIVFKRGWSKLNNKALMGDLGKTFFAMTVYMCISGIWSKNHLFSFLIGMLWMGCFLAYVYASNFLTTYKQVNRIIKWTSYSSGIVGGIAGVEFITYFLSRRWDWFNFRFPNPLYYNINDYVFDLIPFEIVNKPFSSRASATFDNPLILATFLIITIPICTYASLYLEDKVQRRTSRFCLLLSLGGLLCTMSRSAYIAVGFALLIMFISIAKDEKLLKKVLPFILILIVLVPLGLAFRFKLSQSDGLTTSDNSRIIIWQSCLDIFTSSIKNIFIGLGAGNDNIHQLLRDVYKIDRPHAHNLFIELLTEGGLINVIFIVTIVCLTLKKLVRMFSSKDIRVSNLSIMFSSSIVGFIIISMFEFTLQSAKELMMFFFLFGMIEAVDRHFFKK